MTTKRVEFRVQIKSPNGYRESAVPCNNREHALKWLTYNEKQWPKDRFRIVRVEVIETVTPVRIRIKKERK